MSFENIGVKNFDEVRGMVAEYIKERAENGGNLTDCKENIDALMNAFVGLETDELDGAYAYIPGVGFALALSIPFAGLIMNYGKGAAGIGTYVRKDKRKEGHSKALRAELDRKLIKAGFNCVFGGVELENEAGIASMDALEHAKRIQILYRVDLAAEGKDE